MTETLNTTAPKRGRKAVYIVGGLIVLALLAAFALVAYNVVAAPAIAKATAAKCHEAYSAPAAREACTSGDTTKAAAAQKVFKAQQKRAAVAAACSAKYTSTLAIVVC
jgi:hypothetical protein